MKLTVNFLGKDAAGVSITDERYPGEVVTISLVRPDGDKKPDRIRLTSAFRDNVRKTRVVNL